MVNDWPQVGQLANLLCYPKFGQIRRGKLEIYGTKTISLLASFARASRVLSRHAR